jgi:hypothetical protein
VAQVVVVDERADPEPLGQGGDGREIRDRRRLQDEMVRQDERRDAHRLGRAGPLAELAGGGRLERAGEEAEGLHARRLAAGRPSGPRRVFNASLLRAGRVTIWSGTPPDVMQIAARDEYSESPERRLRSLRKARHAKIRNRGSSDLTTDIARGSDLTGAPLWTRTVPGHAAHVIVPDPETGSVYVSDGWGVEYAAIRFHRFDGQMGGEAASIRTGTSVRCFRLLKRTGDLLAATDNKLLRLDAMSLVEGQRWDARIPRYTNTMAVRGRHAVLADWLNPKVGLVDLTTGRVRRRQAPAMTLVLDGPGDPLLIGGKSGGVVRIDASTGDEQSILDTPPALDAALSDDGGVLWLLDGVRAVVTTGPTTATTKLGHPSRTLRRYRLDASEAPASFTLPFGVRAVVPGRTQLWIHDGQRNTSDTQHVAVVAFPVDENEARVWTASSGHSIAAVDPDSRLVFTISNRRHDPDAAELTCTQIIA